MSYCDISSIVFTSVLVGKDFIFWDILLFQQVIKTFQRNGQLILGMTVVYIARNYNCIADTSITHYINRKYTGCYDDHNGCAAHGDSCIQADRAIDFTEVAYKSILRATE